MARVAVLQMAAVDGDVGGNLEQIACAARVASAAHAKIIVAPELSLTGYAAASRKLRKLPIARHS